MDDQAPPLRPDSGKGDLAMALACIGAGALVRPAAGWILGESLDAAPHGPGFAIGWFFVVGFAAALARPRRWWVWGLCAGAVIPFDVLASGTLGTTRGAWRSLLYYVSALLWLSGLAGALAAWWIRRLAAWLRPRAA